MHFSWLRQQRGKQCESLPLWGLNRIHPPLHLISLKTSVGEFRATGVPVASTLSPKEMNGVETPGKDIHGTGSPGGLGLEERGVGQRWRFRGGIVWTPPPVPTPTVPLLPHPFLPLSTFLWLHVKACWLPSLWCKMERVTKTRQWHSQESMNITVREELGLSPLLPPDLQYSKIMQMSVY